MSSWGRKGAYRTQWMRRRGNIRRLRENSRDKWELERADIADTKENKEWSCNEENCDVFMTINGFSSKSLLFNNHGVHLQFWPGLGISSSPLPPPAELPSFHPTAFQFFLPLWPSRGDPWRGDSPLPTALHWVRHLHCSTPIKGI